MNKLVLEVVAILGLAFLGATCIIVVGGQNAASRPAPVAQAPKPVAPPPVAPTQAPPTVAAIAPTAPPPEPTAAPTAPPPKPEPKPAGVSVEARAYLDWALPKIEVASQAMRGLAMQSEQASQNPRLLADNGWRVKTGVALGFLKTTGQELQVYPGKVTPELSRLDDLMKGLGRDLVFVADEFAGGLDQGNVARINAASTRMNAATQKMQEATAEVQKLNRGGA